ncbi:hypothetical protein ACFE04_029344 [Oxalis oulophora]
MTKPKRVFTLLLRLLALGATLAAAIVMGTSHEKVSVFGLSLEAKFSDTPSFKYFVIANAIVSVYSLVILFVPAESSLWRLVVASDLVFTTILASSLSAALAVAQIGKKGSAKANWLPICGQVPKYCDHVSGALISGFIAAILYLFIVLYSIHTVVFSALI